MQIPDLPHETTVETSKSHLNGQFSSEKHDKTLLQIPGNQNLSQNPSTLILDSINL